VLQVPSWWFKTTQLNNMIVKMGIFPNFRGENEKYLKPTTQVPSLKENAKDLDIRSQGRVFFGPQIACSYKGF